MPDGGEPRPELSVVLSTLGNYELLKRVLDGYSRQDAPSGSFELIVVADMADPDPAAVDAAIGERDYPARRLTGRYPGLSANRNTGWRQARGRLVLFTDNDTIPVPRLVSEHIAWHRKHPEEEVAVVGHVRWARELHMTTFMRWLDRGIQFDYPNIKGIEAGWGRLYGANSSIKRSFIERVGDYDERNLPYLYEDLDWAYRASKLGLRVLYNRRAVVDHIRSDLTLELYKGRIRQTAIAERAFVRKHPELPAWFHNIYTHASGIEPARGRGLKLAPFVPPWVPWLGPKVWTSVDTYYKQQLAPHFLAAWDEAGRDGDGPAQPEPSEPAAGSERGSNPSGSRPGGP